MTGLNPTLVSQAPLNMQSGRLGGYLGYNWQFAPRWLAGIEGDFGWTGHTGKLPGFGFLGTGIMGLPSGADLSLRTTWDASARLRLGFLVTPTTLDLCDRRLRLAASGGDVLVQLAGHLQRRSGQLRAVLVHHRDESARRHGRRRDRDEARTQLGGARRISLHGL